MKKIKSKIGIGRTLGLITLAGLMGASTSGCIIGRAWVNEVEQGEKRRQDRVNKLVIDTAKKHNKDLCTNEIEKRDGTWNCVYFRDKYGTHYRKINQEHDGSFTYEIEGVTYKLGPDNLKIVK